ncbi:Peroxiredoxin Q, chloroplastic (Fragment) [Seminavis robusta]|uniref:thioredoxin-dependent peroxiredoxin n=1 Tax=Seminavis robusta TaxID=568900 RepID=A0A9N8HTQ6_9STRA
MFLLSPINAHKLIIFLEFNHYPSNMKFTTTIAALLIGSASAFTGSAPAARSSSTALNLAVGETAPDFALVDQNGKTVKRSQIKKPLVVYFYPADATPGCTVQAQSFNEQVKDIRKTFGAELVGISGQDVESKQAFASELGLDFSILADEGDAVRKAFGVPRAAFGLFPGRVTYVLDKDGACQTVYDELADAASHVEVAKESLSELKGASKKGASSPLGAIFGR